MDVPRSDSGSFREVKRNTPAAIALGRRDREPAMGAWGAMILSPRGGGQSLSVAELSLTAAVHNLATSAVRRGHRKSSVQLIN